MFIETASTFIVSIDEQDTELEISLILRVTVPGESGVTVSIGLPDLSSVRIGDEDSLLQHLFDSVHTGLAHSDLELPPAGIRVDLRSLRVQPNPENDVQLSVLRSLTTIVAWSVASLREGLHSFSSPIT